MRQSALLLPILAVLAGGLFATPAWPQTYKPSRPIELVVHSAPGGGSDVFARAVVEMVDHERLLPQPIRVVNKTAGASLEAMAYLVEKKGDDHTIGIFTNTWVATPLTSKEGKYTVKDLTPIVRLVLEPTIAVVKGDSPYKSMGDFVEAAKKNPGDLKQAGGSVTAIESLTGLLIQSATGAKWTFISTPAVKDRIANLLAGNVQIIIPQPQDVNEHVVAGRVRPIAALTEKRLTVLPNVPTIKEQGINIPIIANARGILAPPGVSREVVAYWEDFFARLVKTPSWKKYVEENQVEDVFLKSEELAPFFDEQIQLMRSVLQQAGVKVVR
ncbi:MAG: tripartite tricarboxylate transporter substrate binding protein [Deltaproteobacteria bacterium]|nr:MAG: tripartite tricarboxylate transporter substrate binding protein [Deltaproteobacteria bacterium]